jgi:subtilisin family serine protease
MRRFVLLTLALGSLLAYFVAPVEAAPAATPAGYLIGTRAPLTAAQSQQLRDAGAQLRHVYTNFGGASAVMTSDRVARVRGLPFVTSVNPDTLKQVTAAGAGAPPQALPGTPYWLDQMDQEKATETGAGVWVAVLDTGFYPNWRDYLDPDSILADRGRAFVGVLGNQNANQWDRGSDPHGMAVSATIVGHRFVDDSNEGGWGQGFATGAAGAYTVPGVAPGAKVIPVKVCEPIGCYGSAINAGVDYVTSVKKANPGQPIVLNASLGGFAFDPVEKAAVDAAVATGVVFVASAGNEGDHGMGFPAAYEPVISVAAGGWTEQWSAHPDKTWWLEDVPETGVGEVYIAGFSSRQKAGQYLDVVSEGRYLLLPYPCAQYYKDGAVTRATEERSCAAKASPDNAAAAPFQYLFMSGTSFSSPAVAGVVALMLQRNPGLSNAGAAPGTIDQPATWGAGPLELALEGSAVPIAPGSATVTHRTGAPLTETWGADATGAGWILVDQAVAAA